MKNLILFFLVILVTGSCSINRQIQSAHDITVDKTDYIIYIRSTNPSPTISEILSGCSGKLTVELVRSGEFNFMFSNQTELQVTARGLSSADLQNFLSTLGKSPGIVEISYYKIP